MRLSSRVRSLQRILVAPFRIEDADPELLAAFDAIIGDDPDEPPGGGPQSPGARFFRFVEDCRRNARGQEAPRTDIFSLLPRLAAAAVKSLTSAIAPALRRIY